MTSFGIWADVYTAAGTRIGPGPIETFSTVSIERSLDMAGGMNASVPLTDKRADDLIQNERRLRFYLTEDGRTFRDLGTMIVRKIIRERATGGGNLRVTGPGELKELEDKQLWLNFVYGDPSGEALEDVLDELLTFATGWTSNVDSSIASDLISGRFDGTNVLEAVKFIAKRTGYHFRQTPNQKILEFAPFGEDNGLIIENPAAYPDVYYNDQIAIHSQLSVTEDSEDIYNVLLPVASGEGSSAITLADSDRTTPYTIQTVTGQDGQSFSVLKDTASIALYGERHKVLAVKNITPTSNTAAARTDAANQLYDFAAVDLARNSLIKTEYKITAHKVNQAVFAGDKIRLIANDEYEHFTPNGDSEGFKPIDVNSLFWITQASELINLQGSTHRFTLSNVDEEQRTIEKDVVDTIRDMELSKLAVKTYSTAFTYSSQQTLAGWGNYPTPQSFERDANFTLLIDDSVTNVQQVFFRFQTFPIVINMTADTTNIVTPPTQLYYYMNIWEDSRYPKNLYILINDVDVTTELGGPWNSAAADSAIDVTLDITPYIQNAVGGIYQAHSIKVQGRGTYPGESRYLHPAASTYPSQTSASTNRGVVEGTFTLHADVQALFRS